MELNNPARTSYANNGIANAKARAKANCAFEWDCGCETWGKKTEPTVPSNELVVANKKAKNRPNGHCRTAKNGRSCPEPERRDGVRFLGSSVLLCPLVWFFCPDRRDQLKLDSGLWYVGWWVGLAFLTLHLLFV